LRFSARGRDRVRVRDRQLARQHGVRVPALRRGARSGRAPARRVL